MSKNEILTELYLDENFNNIINKITSNNSLKEDLIQDLFLILSEKDDSFIIDAYNNKYLIYYCIRILKNQYHSSNSPFHKKHRKHQHSEINNIEIENEEYDLIIDNNIEIILHIIESKLDYVDRELIKMYYKLGEYNLYDGEKRDDSCTNTISSLRKIHKKLALISEDGYKISVSIQTISNSINRSKMIIKNNLKKYDN